MREPGVLIADLDEWDALSLPGTIVVLSPDAPKNAAEVLREHAGEFFVDPGRRLVRVDLGPNTQPIVVVAGDEFADVAQAQAWVAECDDSVLARQHSADDSRWRHWVAGSSYGIPEAGSGEDWVFTLPRRSHALRQMAGRWKRRRQRATWRRMAQPR